ncbi:hypothetical protein SPOG_04284 [Schizosaccharomyces cryophilus OY26]|uniref:Uncharacterized protein n=1 Tax=Schizosaccharomyces cryophilus (strain OY26 / ATCC MYA-4695 / CBS 11777 / NBRC 106824 / NRRL Y48691) TaxID=653667 RepID=S9X6I7_SCHCR|nr:uncharacterized protein SPOG_04284 [Schizosaccharomyces cryophilus OY26]EPY49366.1 hypothetical protein SPOG_04284 [Schizosaccharomyces cryophilus OY26]
MIYINFPLVYSYLDIGKIFLKPLASSVCIFAVLCFFQNLESIFYFSQDVLLWIAYACSTITIFTYLTVATFLETIIITVLFPFKLLYKIGSLSVNASIVAVQKFIIYASWILGYQETLQVWSQFKESSLYDSKFYKLESCFRKFPSVTAYIYCLDGKVQLIWRYGQLEHLTPIIDGPYVEADGEKISFNVNGKNAKMQQIVREYFHNEYSSTTHLFRCNQIFKLYCLSGIKTDFFPGLLEYETSTGKLNIAQKETIERSSDQVISESEINDTYADTDYWKSIFEEEESRILFEWDDETENDAELNNSEKNEEENYKDQSQDTIAKISSEDEGLNRNLLPALLFSEDSTKERDLVIEATSFVKQSDTQDCTFNLGYELEEDYGKYETQCEKDYDPNLLPILPIYEEAQNKTLERETDYKQTHDFQNHATQCEEEEDSCLLPIIPIYGAAESKAEKKEANYNQRDFYENYELSCEEENDPCMLPIISIFGETQGKTNESDNQIDISTSESTQGATIEEEKSDEKDMFPSTNKLILECLDYMKVNWGLDDKEHKEEDNSLNEIRLEKRNDNVQQPGSNGVNTAKEVIADFSDSENIRPLNPNWDSTEEEEDDDDDDNGVMKFEKLLYEPFDDDNGFYLEQTEHYSGERESYNETEKPLRKGMEIDNLQFMDEEKNKTLKMQLCMSFLTERFLQPYQTETDIPYDDKEAECRQ